MEKYLVIKADTNDGDYITRITKVEDTFLEKYKELIKGIKNCKFAHNWPSSEYEDDTVETLYSEFDLDLVENFAYYVPHGEYGVHTIESIKILNVESTEELL